MAMPEEIAQVSASDQPIRGETGVPGGSAPLSRRQTAPTSILLIIPAASPLRPPTARQPSPRSVTAISSPYRRATSCDGLVGTTSASRSMMWVVKLSMPHNLVVAAEQQGRQAWLSALADTVVTLTEHWSVQVGEPFQPGGQTAWVAPVHDAAGAELV